MRWRLDARMIQARRRLLQRHLDSQGRCNLDSAHTIAFAVALNRVAVAQEEMGALLIDAQGDSIASGDFLDVEIAAMRPIIDGQDCAMHWRNADDSDHRLNRQLQVFVPVYEAVFDL